MIPPGDPMDPTVVAGEIDREVRALPAPGVQPVRAVRRAWSGRLRPVPAEAVVAVAMALVDRQRWVAYELLTHHPGALDHLSVQEVSTVPLNLRSRGRTGDTGRTLDICRRLAADDDMMVKALSWTPTTGVLAAKVRREVRSKLETGRKHPARRAT